MNGTPAYRLMNRASKPPCCYHCMKRRIRCDGSKPACQKCLRKGLCCPGYGTRYRFIEGQTKVINQPVSVYVASPALSAKSLATRRALLWPDGTRTSPEGHVPSMPCPNVSDSVMLIKNQPDLTPDISATRKRTQIQCHSPAPSRSLELVDSLTRELFAHFSTSIAPVMVAVDGKTNGYRHILLPLALSDGLVREGVRVTALHFVAFSRPSLRNRADQAMQLILRDLQARASSATGLVDLSAWASTVLLLLAEIVTGGSDFPHLFEMLKHLAVANTASPTTTELHAFLVAQTQMMTFFAQPLVQEIPDRLWTACYSERIVDSILGDAHLQPSLSHEFQVYQAAIRTACDIYVTRATINPSYSDTIPQLNHLQALCEPVKPTTPGQHILVWVYFLAAAESSTVHHRNFFTNRLRDLHYSTKFRNIPVALAALENIWKVRPQRRWTEALSELAPIFII